MRPMLTLHRYSFGVGDRFAHQAKAQLLAFQKLAADGVTVVPVWNKSNREHIFIGSEPASVRAAAAAAVGALGWKEPWHVDADHIRLETVDSRGGIAEVARAAILGRPERGAGGEFAVLMQFEVGQLEPGDYRLRLRLEDRRSGQSAVSEARFRVGRPPLAP